MAATIDQMKQIPQSLGEFYIGGAHFASGTGDVCFFYLNALGLFLVRGTSVLTANLSGQMEALNSLDSVPSEAWDEFVAQVKVALEIRKTYVANRETQRDTFIASL